LHCRNLLLVSRNSHQHKPDRYRGNHDRLPLTDFGRQDHLFASRARAKTLSTELDATVSPQSDEFFMQLAVEEARKADRKGEVPVGAVLVCEEGNVIARAHNVVETSTDPTAHAELLCLRQASKKLQSWRLLGTTLYVTLEPCPMCAGALLQSRVKRVVWGAPNVQLGADGSWISLLREDDDGEEEEEGLGEEEESGEGDGPKVKIQVKAAKHPYHFIQVRRNFLRDECSLLLTDFFKRRRSQAKDEEKKDE
jgi:tRNA(adenine34) deaminase